MTAVVMVLLGAGVGLGVLLTWRALAPRPPSIDAILAGLARPGTAIDTSAPAAHDQFDRIGSTARRVVEALGYDAERHHQELDLVGRTPERHAFDKLLGAVAGLLVPNLAATALVVMGIPAPVGLIAILSVVTAVAGFLMPDMLLRDEADKRRRAFRHTLSSYLDLVNVLLAGGAGIETALHAAADAGDGCAGGHEGAVDVDNRFVAVAVETANDLLDDGVDAGVGRQGFDADVGDLLFHARVSAVSVP